MYSAGFRRHLSAATTRYPLVRFTGLSHGGAVQLRTTLGTDVGAVEGSARRRRERDVLSGFAVIDCVIRQCRPGKEQPGSDNRGES